MSLSVDGFWKSGFWATTFWADGFWREGDYVPTVTPAPSTIGGWFDYHGTVNIAKKRQKEIEEEAKQVIEEIRAEPLAIAKIQPKAESVSKQLKEIIAALEQRVAEYHAELDAQASFLKFSEQQQAKQQAAELHYLMIQAELQAEEARQQVEELDVVFMAITLLSI